MLYWQVPGGQSFAAEDCMKIDDFNSRLCDHILVADGGMGSMLYE